MIRLFLFLLLALLTSPITSHAQARRIEVLFLGSDNGSHKPLERFRTIRRVMGIQGINFTYTNNQTSLTKKNLAKYDALLVYGNHDVLQKGQETALLDYSKNGGACVFLHSACGCFRNSEAYIKLLGAQFKSHGTGVFRVETTLPDHELMKGYQGFECWDETYIHQKHNQDRTVLQMHEAEPWTWVRTNGKGRIFYTASGHDERCWQQPNYQDLIYRAILWSIGPEKAKLHADLKLPKLSYYKPNVNIIPAKSYGIPLDRKVPHNELQNPLPVTESIKLAQVPADFQLEIFASEPDIINPIALNWDEKGRMWAVEAYDYPNNHVMNKPGHDRIKILEDTDNDGKADKVTTFADGLTICTSVLPYGNGCITTDGQDMIYLHDTNGDGKSDKRQILFSGLKIWDTHACTSNLRYGIDGWIYATVGYSGLDVKIGNKRIKSSQGVFRFKPDGSDLEILQNTSNNTWGLGFTEEGRVMGSTANNNPSWWFDVPLTAYAKAGIKPQRTPRADSNDLFFPLTYDYLQVDCKERITAGAGHTIYTSRLFPKNWWNQRALICDPTGKLVAAPQIIRQGAGFKTTGFEQNIYASADAWSAPVAAEVGPDGAIYIADWYNSIVQHNIYGDDQIKGKGNAYLNDHRDRKHGRIYRIAPKRAKPNPNPKLETLGEQLATLAHPDLFWRLTAQRILAQNPNKNTTAALTQFAENDNTAAAHALYSIATSGNKTEIQKIALKHLTAKNPTLQLAATRLLESSETNALHLISTLENLTPDSQHAALLTITQASLSKKIKTALEQKIILLQKDENLIPALTVALASQGAPSSAATEIKRHFPLSASANRGAKIYQSATCIACHQPDGEGVDKAFPPLNQSEWLSNNHEHAIRIILKGLNGPIKVRGKKFNGGMPAQQTLSDQEITDVLNYARNSWDNHLGDINKSEVTRVRAQLKNRTQPFTASDFTTPTKPKPIHHYDFTKDLKDHIGNAHASLGGHTSNIKPSPKGIDFSNNTGERCNQIENDTYINLPNNIISNAAKAGVEGELTIETTLQVSENRPWAWAWAFGSSDQGEDKSNGASKTDYLALIPMNANTKKLRLCARGASKENYFDAKTILEPNKLHHIVATFTRSHMDLYLNGSRIGSHQLPEKLDLTTFKNDNNWLGRSQFQDPTFDGTYKSLKIYPTKLNKKTIQKLSKP